MSPQLDLWPPGGKPARARRGDPLSSHAAADRAERSGSIGRQARLALALVTQNPGLTSRELAGFGVLDRYQLARRLPELERRGLVRTTDADVEKRWWRVDR